MSGPALAPSWRAPHYWKVRETASRVVGSYLDAIPKGHGRAVLVDARTSSEAGDVVQEVMRTLKKQQSGSIVIRGNFRRGYYTPEPTNHSRKAIKSALRIASSAASLAPGHAFCEQLVKALISVSDTVLDTVDDFHEGSKHVAAADRADEALRLLEELTCGPPARHVVVAIADVDRADDHWFAFFIEAATSLLATQPIFFVFTRRFSARADRVMSTDRRWDQLIRDRRITLLEVAGLSEDDIRRWLVSADDDVLDRLVLLGGCNSDLTRSIWGFWSKRGMVVLDQATDTWRFAADAEGTPVPNLSTLIQTRITDLVGDANAPLAGRLRDALLLGALEGSTFTAPAIADSLGRDRDELIDELDEIVVNAEHPYGLLIDSGFHTVGDPVRGDRYLCLYSFASLDQWETLSAAAGPHELALARKLADVLCELYVPDVPHIARAIARIYERLGATGDANRFHQISLSSLPPDVCSWQATVLGKTTKENWLLEDYALAAAITLQVGKDLIMTAPAAEALDVLRQSVALAREAGDKHLEIDAFCNIATLSTDFMGQLDEADAAANAALTLATEIRSSFHQAAVMSVQAVISYARGDDLSTQRLIDDVRERLGPHGNLNLRAGNDFVQSKLIWGPIEAGILNGSLDYESQDVRSVANRAYAYALGAANAFREGSDRNYCGALQMMAHIRLGLRQTAEARNIGADAIAASSACRNRRVECVARVDVGTAAAWLGQLAEGARQYADALRISQELDDVNMEALILAYIAALIWNLISVRDMANRLCLVSANLYSRTNPLRAAAQRSEAQKMSQWLGTPFDVVAADATAGYASHRGWEWIRSGLEAIDHVVVSGSPPGDR
jgi:tetratricopeptide (TPR) repeat protein